MFVFPNPGKRKGHAKAKHHRLSGYRLFVRKYMASHKGAKLADAARAWSEGEGRVRKHKAARRVVNKHGAKWVSKDRIPAVIASAVRGAVCGGESSLERARVRYCGASSIGSTREERLAALRRVHGADYMPTSRDLSGFSLSSNRGRRGKRKGGKRRKSAIAKIMGNPSAIAGNLKGMVTSGFSVGTIKETLPVVGGFALTPMLAAMISQKLPAMFQSGVGSYAIGLAAAGLLGAAGRAANVNGTNVLLGGIAAVLTKAVGEFSKGGLKGLSGVDGMDGLDGFGDYFTPSSATNAIPTESGGQFYSQPLMPPASSGEALTQGTDREQVAVAQAMASDGADFLS
jgi:hypothetical protein